MLRDRLLPDDPIDEYRDLAMLAHEWERGSLKTEVTEEAPGRVDDAEGKEPAGDRPG